MNLKAFKTRALKEVQASNDLKTLNQAFEKYLGKESELGQVFVSLKRLPKARRTKMGKAANELKNFLRIKFDEKARELKEKTLREEAKKEWIDITRPGEKMVLGHLHPITLVRRKVEQVFESLGFSIVEGPEMENEYYNFDALNIPKDHPARDLWDTFWIRPDYYDAAVLSRKKGPADVTAGLLLRTHTSPVQVRYMEKNNPPLRIIVPGKCFRHEATDASHDFQFYQVEGLMVDKEVSVANFKAIMQEFFKRFFDKDLKIRLRPCFFPFTEPSFEVDLPCLACSGRGCPACSQTGFMEMMGAGMVHPNVFKAVKLNPKNWQGFAFGMGLDRLAMLKYKINDIRLFFSGDLRFLEQF